MSLCASTGAAVGLNVMGAASRSLRTALLSSALVVASGVVGAKIGGTLGTMWFAAAAAWVGVLVGWQQLRHALRESDTIPVPRWLWPGRMVARSSRSSG
jgi:hypothetical protein